MGPWQQKEVDVALDLQANCPSFPLIAVLLPGCEPPLGSLRQLTWVDLRNQPLDQLILSLQDLGRSGIDTFTRLVGTSRRTVSTWLAGDPPNRANQRNVSEIVRFFEALAEVVPASQIGPWLGTSNPAFEGSTPQFIRTSKGELWKFGAVAFSKAEDRALARQVIDIFGIKN